MKKLAKDLYDGFVNAINSLKNGEDGVYYWKLSVTNGNVWAIVLGWAEDDNEDNDTDKCHKVGYNLAAKIGFQPNNSVMQCDYSIDWQLPYDKETGEVAECEWFFSDKDNPLEIWNSILEDWKENKNDYFKMVE
jgi:hypothetical protein